MNANDSVSSLRILADASPARSDATKLRKLCSLVRFHGEELMRGTTKLSLSIDVLHVILRLVSGDASEITTDGSDPLLFEAACLQDVLKAVLKLKICKPPNPTSAPVVDLSAFEQLTSLEIVGLPLDAISGLNGLSRRLSSITLEKCKFRSGIHDFFVSSAVLSDSVKRQADDDDGVEEAVEWPELREANVVRNELTSLDSSLTLAPRLKILDASYNNLTDEGVESLSRFGQLTRVNLSFNKLKSAPAFGPGSGVFLHTLLLRNNSLETLNGLEGLISLKVLDVAFNFLAWAGALEGLKSLSALTALHLEGNPLFYAKSYRSTVAKYLHPSVMTRKFMLDGTLLTPVEKDALRDAALDRINLVPQPLASFDLNLSRSTPDPETSSFGGASQTSSQPRAKSRRIREALITSTDEYEGSKQFTVGSLRSIGSISSRRSRKAMVTSASSGNLHVVRAIVEKNPIDPNSRPSSGQKTLLSSTPISVDPALTREKLRALRNQYGSDNWLGALAASQATSGLPGEPSPIKSEDVEAKHESVIRPSLGCQRSLVFDDEGVERMDKDQEIDHSATSVDENEAGDVVFFPCGPAGTTEIKQLRCGLTGTVGEDGRLAVAEIRERDANSGAILSRWDVYSLSKVEVDASEDPATIFLAFKTMRKDAQKRSYVMSADNCWALSEFLRPYWEETEGEGSDLGAWECVKCSSQFAKERSNYDPRYGSKVRCPICGSDMVVSLDQLPQPKSDVALDKNVEEGNGSAIGNGDLASKKFSGVRSPVISVKREGGSTRSGSANSNGSSRASGERSSSSTPRLKDIPNSGHSCRPGLTLSKSQPVTSSNNPGSSDASSDIEVLSKASSSSIEVLAREDPEGQEDHEEYSCGVANSGKKPGDSPVGSFRSGINMTSSTSSDSMTASYHTAYNVTHKSSASVRDETFTTPNASVSKLSESVGTNASTQTLVGSMTPSSSTASSSNWAVAIKAPSSATSIVPYAKPGATLSSSYTMLFPEMSKMSREKRVQKDAIRPVIEALNRGTSVNEDCDDKVDACEDDGTGKEEGVQMEEEDKDFYSLSVLKAMAASLLAGRKRHRARDALYFLDERLASGDLSMDASMLTLHDDNDDELTELMMKYDYETFQRFDHRLSLFCDIALFRSSSEELVGIARGEMLMAGFDLPQSALMVVSSKNLYFLQIFGKESDDPDRWLTKIESKPLIQLKAVMKFVGEQGLLMNFVGQSKYPVVGFFTGDIKRTSNLFSFLNNRLKNKKFERDERELTESQMRLLEMSLFEFSQDETLDPCFTFFGVGYSKVSDGTWELKGVMMTASHVSVSSGDLHWMLSLPQFSAKSPSPGSQPVVQQLYPISDLTLVETHSRLPSAITLVFVDRSSRALNDSESRDIGLAEGKAVRDCVFLAYETPRTTRDFLGHLKSAWSSLFSGAELPVVSTSSFGG